jgi:hypothetical protein
MLVPSCTIIMCRVVPSLYRLCQTLLILSRLSQVSVNSTSQHDYRYNLKNSFYSLLSLHFLVRFDSPCQQYSLFDPRTIRLIPSPPRVTMPRSPWPTGRIPFNAHAINDDKLYYNTYRVASLVSVGAFLVGYDCGVVSTIVSERRWIDLMKPAENCTLSFFRAFLF